MSRKCVKKTNTLVKRRSCSGLSSYACHLSISTREKSFIVILSPKTFSSLVTTLWNLETLEFPKFWRTQMTWPSQSLEHLTICHQKSANASPTTIPQMYGHLGVFFMKCALCNMLSLVKTFSASSSRLSKISKVLSLICTHQNWKTWSLNFWWKMRRSDRKW